MNKQKISFYKSNIQLVPFFLIVLSFTGYSQKCDQNKIDSLNKIVFSENVEIINKIDVLNELSKCYSYFDLDSTTYFAELAYAESGKNNYQRGVAHSTYYLADVQNRIGNKVKALELFKQSIDLYNTIEKDLIYFNAVNKTGIIYELQHNYDMALEYNYLGLKEAELLGFKLDIGFFYNNISIIYSYTGDKLNELEHLRKASKIFQELGEDYFYSYTLVNLGSYFVDQKELDSAQNYFVAAEPLLIKDRDYYGLTNLYNNIAHLRLELGSEKEALDYFHKALESAIQLDTINPDRENRISSVKIELGKLYFNRQEFNVAKNYFQAAFSLGLKYESLLHQQSASEGLFKCFIYLNNLDSAYYYHSLSMLYSDSLLSEKYNEKIDQLNYNFELEIQKDLFEKDKALLVLEKNKQELIYLIIGGLLIIIVFIVIIIWYLQKLKLQRSELKRENLRLENENITVVLEKKNRELTTTVLNLIERNEFITKISDQLQESIIMEDDKSNLVENIIKSIDKDTVNSLWKEFEAGYMEVHKDFHQNLTSKYPNLTANERRLCAFIVLNLSTKDISSITYQSPQSIKIARYRLRKKLGLEKNENLTSFLHNL